MPDLVSAALANPINRAILARLPMLGLNDAWLVAGSLCQSLWNRMSGQPVTASIKDYDIFYFEPEALSSANEEDVRRRCSVIYADLDAIIDIRNQARVQFWYQNRFGVDWPPVQSSREAIGRFPVSCTCIGLQPQADGTLDLNAPRGLAELGRGELRANPDCPDPQAFAKKAASYIARWPWLKIVKIDHLPTS